MPTVGKKCPSCKKVHLAKNMEILESLTPKQRTLTFKAEPEHRLFIKGYYCSLNMDNQVWEFYEPLTVWKLSLEPEKEERTEHLCRLCGKSMSEEEEEQFQGYHRDCFYIEEIQDADDL